MIIFIGGLIGTGKTTLARGLSRFLRIPYYDADAVKKAELKDMPYYRNRLDQGIPFPDSARQRVYARVVRDMARLRRRHSHVIIDETLVQRKSRRRLYAAARRYFYGYAVVWVRLSEREILRRLRLGVRRGHMLTNPVAMYYSHKRIFEPLTEADIVFRNTLSRPRAIAALSRRLKPLLAGTGHTDRAAVRGRITK